METQLISILIPKNVLADVDRHAQREATCRSAWVRRALLERIENEARRLRAAAAVDPRP